jgi:hypothetical protein
VTGDEKEKVKNAAKAVAKDAAVGVGVFALFTVAIASAAVQGIAEIFKNVDAEALLIPASIRSFVGGLDDEDCDSHEIDSAEEERLASRATIPPEDQEDDD